jgi:hypothetical protein
MGPATSAPIALSFGVVAPPIADVHVLSWVTARLRNQPITGFQLVKIWVPADLLDTARQFASTNCAAAIEATVTPSTRSCPQSRPSRPDADEILD